MPSLLQIPSYAQGFARYADESDAPGLWKNLVGLWVPALGPTGVTLHDWSGYKNNGTLTNMAPASDWVATEKGWALDFDGDNDFIELGTIPTGHPLQLNGNRCTFSFWLYQVSGGDEYQRIIDKSSAGNGADGYTVSTEYAGNEGQVSLMIDGNVIGAAWPSSYSYSVWVHLVITWDGTTATIYKNGKYHDSDVEADAIPDVAVGMRIGSWNHSTGREFKGQLQMSMIHNRVLTPSEIQSLYTDPYGMLRRKQLTSISVSIPAAATTAKPIYRSYPKEFKPSYAQGFARHADESCAPGLWTGLRGLWVPALGPTGVTLHDVSGYKKNGTLTNMDPATDWVATEKGWALDFLKASSNYVEVLASYPAAPLTIAIITNPEASGSYPGWPATRCAIGVGNSAYSTAALHLYPDRSGTIQLSSKYKAWAWDDTGVSAVSGFALYVFTVDASDLYLYLNAEQIWTAGRTSTPAATNLVRLGSRAVTSPGYYFTGQTVLAAHWGRCLLPNEILSLYADPYAMLRPRRVTLAGAAAAGGLSIPIAMHHYKQMMGAA